ncbi:Ig-like domain-containing protein [Acinetobacter tandoii]|uniref:Big-1 domain-containing protein n=1 Tax=Acinetobacter tandoii DSM 14970 = CIP 107469 TaxID=1120927 RepID=R9B4K8_9GAMM|nr:hypothetical protein [Acinetobacter tandoii]EOR09449.1 hypothetical protein I593_01158 [Acinetobacter tandoii DSM 14970 = CIP 107469]
MNNKQIGLKLSTIALCVLLASCGGGGSGGYFENNNSGGVSTGGGSSTSAVNIGTISLFDVNNKATTAVTIAGATASVKVTDSSGKGISGALVKFTGGGVEFGTSNGAVLTNAEGVASIAIKPTNITDTGSYQLSATAEYDGKTATSKPYYFTLQAANILFANLAAVNPTLESGASTNINLKTQDASTGENQNNVTVNFTTSCGTFDNSSVVSSNQGDVTSTYKAIDANGKLCEGTQTITVSGSNGAISKTISVNIASIEANSLVYTSDAVNLGIQSSGSASSGQIEFTVYANGVPASNKDVNIELVRGPEGLSFVTFGNKTAKTLKSDSTGKIVVNLYPGNKPGPVEIKATLASNSNVYALSKNVAISTGRVTQNGLSISVSKNSLQNDKDGDTAIVTARMVDRVGNPVPDGTVISFLAEGGSITPNCASTEGACSVTLATQNPRPVDNRVTVLAYVEGDKSFIDVDGDNVYNAAVDKLEDKLGNSTNIGDFFRDDNEDNTYNANLGEFIYKRGAKGTCGASLMTEPNIAGTCDTNLDAVIRQQLIFAFASDTPTFYGVSGVNTIMTDITSNIFTFQVYGNSAKTVPMPSGTTVAVTVKDNTDNNLDCEADILSGDVKVPSVVAMLTPSTFTLDSNEGVKYTARLQKCVVGDDVKITINAPNKITTRIITLN